MIAVWTYTLHQIVLYHSVFDMTGGCPIIEHSKFFRTIGMIGWKNVTGTQDSIRIVNRSTIRKMNGSRILPKPGLCSYLYLRIQIVIHIHHRILQHFIFASTIGLCISIT